MPSNDNDPAPREAPSASPEVSGQAALLLVESLIHGLCEAAVLSTGQAVEILQRAIDVQVEQADEAAGSMGRMAWRSHALLASIAASLSVDAGDPTGDVPTGSGV